LVNKPDEKWVPSSRKDRGFIDFVTKKDQLKKLNKKNIPKPKPLPKSNGFILREYANTIL
jgi:hypothetical protein